jgi:hypothetical protein
MNGTCTRQHGAAGWMRLDPEIVQPLSHSEEFNHPARLLASA